MTIKTQQIELFVAICHTRSLSMGGEKLGLPKATASRMLKQLEQTLGCRLINRSPHHFALTPEGEEFLAGASDIQDQLAQLTQQISRKRDNVSGRLRICAPSALLLLIQGEALKAFTQTYPDLKLEFLTGSPKPRVIEDNFDLIININTPKDSALVARRLIKVKLNYYTSPDYLKQYGTPTSPLDLLEHRCIVNLNQDRAPLTWQYPQNGKLHKLAIKASHQSDNGLVIKEMIKQGLGVALLPEFLCAKEANTGELVTLFNNQYAYSIQVYGIYPSRDLMPTKTRVFLEFLAQHFDEDL